MTRKMIETQPNPKTNSAEQAELEAVLASETFRRAPTLARILEYLCERQLRGESFIKEYEIATQVMGRSSDFDPQQDGSVRVNLHHLRKKLRGFYEAEGATHALWIKLPIGQSLPSFVARPSQAEAAELRSAEAGLPPENGSELIALAAIEPEAIPPAATPASVTEPATETGTASPIPVLPAKPRRASVLLAISLGAALLGCLLTWLWMRGHPAGEPPVVITDATLRLGCGLRHPLRDTAGRSWSADAYFQGGSPFYRPVSAIGGASNSQIYQRGREGNFTYDIPLPRAVYELHLYFAETGVHGEGFRTMQIWINGKSMAQYFDVTSDAGGFANATEKVYTAVQPAADGKLHLRFTGDNAAVGAFLNAVEILPGNGDAIRPIRQTTLSTYSFDPQGMEWAPDAWFHGGRVNYLPSIFPNLPLQGFYKSERFGNFTYSIPVPPNRTYSLTLYFQDAWFSHQARQPPNNGQRRFDVICNGQMLLSQFDILREAGGDGFRVVKRFTGIQPTTQGKIMLSFTPSQNYAVLNALAIEQEPVAAAVK